MTYPEVSEIRTEWTPEQIAPTESERKAHEVQQQRLAWWQAHSEEVADPELRTAGMTFAEKLSRPIPTVCPKR